MTRPLPSGEERVRVISNNKRVKVYSTPTCPFCTMAKDFLSQNNIPFEDTDVSHNKEAAFEMISKTGQTGVPVIDIDGKIILGFDKEIIKAELNIT